MTLSDLIAHVGNDNVEVHTMGDILINVSRGAKAKFTTLTLKVGTNAVQPSDFVNGNPSHLGLFILLPADRVEAARAELADKLESD